LYRNGEPIEEVGDQSQLTVRYAAEAQRFIRESRGRPFFLYVPFAMPHLPVSAPEHRRGRSRHGLYGDTIETLDWAVGEILRTLKEEGRDAETLVLFTSDNGPWHNLPPRMLAKGVEPWHTGTKGVFRGAKGTSYEGGLRVPAIFRWPGTIPAGEINMDMASALDLFPTLVKAAEAELPADRVYDGYDIMPVLRGGAKSPREVFFYHLGKSLEAVREGPWKYRFARARTEAGPAPEPPVPELFHLDWDPAEQYNVYERHRDIGDRLAAMLKQKAQELGAQ
jgi:arylsulfatase A-like enzyme